MWDYHIRKQTKMSHKKVQHITINHVLELVHMELMGPMQVESITGNKRVFVCIYGYSKYTWVEFIHEKFDVFTIFERLCQCFLCDKGENFCKIICICNDHGREFENSTSLSFVPLKELIMSFRIQSRFKKMVLSSDQLYFEINTIPLFG